LTTRFTIPPVPQDSRLTYVATIDLGKRRLLPYGARITSSSIPLSIQFAASHNSHDWIPLLTLPYLNRGVVGYAPARTHVPPGDWARFTFPTPEHALRPRVRLSKKATTWPEAQRWCELNGYRLAVSLTDAQVVDLCRRHGESDGYQVWVGARARDGGAVLIDGTPARRSIAEEHLTAAQDDCGLALELTNNDAVHPHYVVPRTPLRFLYTFATPRPGSLEHLLDQSWAVHRRDTHQDALCVLFKREFRSATSGEVHKDGGWTALGTWRFENGTLHITSDIHGLPRSYPYIWDVQRSAWVNKSQTTLLEPIRPLP
ncbi:MAG: C-type lectin domain-containing protein, partial [Oceanidesulfovibrio sp.]